MVLLDSVLSEVQLHLNRQRHLQIFFFEPARRIFGEESIFGPLGSNRFPSASVSHLFRCVCRVFHGRITRGRRGLSMTASIPSGVYSLVRALGNWLACEKRGRHLSQ